MSSNENRKESFHPKRKLRNYLINSKFQLKWTAIVVVVNMVLCLALAVPLYHTAASASDQMLALRLGEPQVTPQAMSLFVEQNARDKENIILALSLFLGILFIGATLSWIVLTHRFAGPVFHLRKILHSIDDFNLKVDVHSRKHDELKDVVGEFNQMISRLAECRREDAELLQRTAEKLRSGATPEDRNEMLKALESLASRYKRSIE